MSPCPDPVEAHGQLFVAAYNILDDLWLQREASYMDFPAVLRRADEGGLESQGSVELWLLSLAHS